MRQIYDSTLVPVNEWVINHNKIETNAKEQGVAAANKHFLKILTRLGFQAKQTINLNNLKTIKQKNYMKNTSTPFLALAFFALVFNFISIHANAQNQERIRVIFGTRTHPNSQGTGCEGDKGTCIIITLKDKVAIDNPGIAEISVKEGMVEWTIIEDSSPAVEDENILYVYNLKEIPKEICRELGYDNITLLPGEYYLDKSKVKLGRAEIRAEIN